VSQTKPQGARARGGNSPFSVPALNVQEFARLSGKRGLLEVLGTWALLALVIGAHLLYPGPWTYALAFVLVASRQYALLVLMHDAFHSLLHPNRRVNDMIGAWLIGAPCGSSYWGSRNLHLEHHRKLGKTADPEFLLYSVGPPREKRSAKALTAHFLRLMLGEQILHTHFRSDGGWKHQASGRVRSLVSKLGPVLIAQCVLFGAFFAAGAWLAYFGLWIMPLVTLVVLLNGLRVFCDHANPVDEPDDEYHRLVSYVSTPLERFFVAPFHMNYHAEHHLFTYVPHYRLPALRRTLQASREVSTVVQWRLGYVRFVREFLRLSA